MSPLTQITPFVSAGIAGLFVVLTLSVHAAFRHARERRFRGLELRPNCLLTRHPIVFISKQKSLFSFFDYWLDAAKYLREHGYEVLIVTPVPSHTLSSVLGALDEMPTKCHLIALENEESLLRQLAETQHANISSLTLVSSKAESPSTRPVSGRFSGRFSGRISVHDLQPTALAIEIFDITSSVARNSWERESKFLDHAISLAERDSGCCD